MKQEQGFTLIELLVAMVISLVVMSGIYSAYSSQQKAHEMTEQVTTVQQNLRVGMYFLEQDIRMAGYDPTGSTLFGFTGANANTTTFTMDTDRDGVLDGNETFTYSLVSGDLMRSGTTLVEYISGVTLAYLDEDGNITGNMNNIRSIGITMSGLRGGHNRTVQTRIHCRNMGL